MEYSASPQPAAAERLRKRSKRRVGAGERLSGEPRRLCLSEGEERDSSYVERLGTIGIAPVVDDARNTIVGNSRQFPRPLHPRLIEVRCFENDFVALSFEEWVPPYIGMSYAVAVGQSGPPDGHRVWEGGYHLDSIGPASSIERELATQLGDEVACD